MKKTISWLAALLLAACADGVRDPENDALSPLRVGALLGSSEVTGYERAFEPRTFSFPADHGPHPGFQSEWWYFVGNLATSAGDGRRFGFQLTFFRFAVAPEDPDNPERPARPSAWATRQVWMAHFALTDAAAGRFYAFERFRRGAMGLAGASAGPGETFHVWLDDWSAEGLEPGSLLPLRLAASVTGEESQGSPLALDLTLSPGKPPVLQGDAGLSQKGPEPGNASYYYSLTRLPAEGAVIVGAERFEVSGTAWLDREWSTSALGPDEVGWDWFALQLDDPDVVDSGEPWELMLYRIRRADGTASATSAGTWVSPDGSSRRLAWQDATVEVLDRWRSPHSDTVYPAGWRIRLPEQDLDLTLHPVLADQELDVSFRYWEGAVEVSGTRAGRPITGRGYVELTGYRAQ